MIKIEIGENDSKNGIRINNDDSQMMIIKIPWENGDNKSNKINKKGWRKLIKIISTKRIINNHDYEKVNGNNGDNNKNSRKNYDDIKLTRMKK